jgi:hypothetical protein
MFLVVHVSMTNVNTQTMMTLSVWCLYAKSNSLRCSGCTVSNGNSERLLHQNTTTSLIVQRCPTIGTMIARLIFHLSIDINPLASLSQF